MQTHTTVNSQADKNRASVWQFLKKARPALIAALMLNLLLGLNGFSIATTPSALAAPKGVVSGRMIGSGLAIGYAPNNFAYLANNIVAYSFAHSLAATNQFAIFQSHDPWGATVVKTAITNAGHTYTVFTPAQLTGFTFSDYRVVILNWDDHFTTDFNPPYASTIPALETYVKNGGVLWVQAAIQGSSGNNFAMPFGGSETWDLNGSDYIVDTTSPMVTGAPNPLTGSLASHGSYSGLPGGAHIVITKTDANGLPVLYDHIPCPSAPAAPTLLSPTDGATVTKTKVPLDWNDVNCAGSYKVKVKDTTTQTLAFNTTVTVSNAKTTPLTHSHTYRWSVKACNAGGCTRSARQTFTVQ